MEEKKKKKRNERVPNFDHHIAGYFLNTESTPHDLFTITTTIAGKH